MKRSLFISLAFVLALVVMAGLSWQWYRNRIALIESDRWENHTYTVMVQLEELLLILTGAETEQRDFIITGSEEYLQPYNRALSMVGQKLASLRSLLQDNPAQQKRLDVIEPLAQAKLAELQQTIELRRTSGFGAASQVVEARRGKSLMDQIRQEVTQARAAEARLLKQRTLAKEAGLQTSFWTALVGGIMSGGLLLAAFLLLKREQAATRASEVRYRRLFEAAHDGVLLLDTHSQKITDANPFMTKLLGYPREELVGKELWQIGLRENSKTSRAAFERLVHEGQTRFEDLPLQTKTGTAREVEFVSNVYDEDGRSVVQCNIRDITQRKQAEEALRESEKRYRTLFEAMDEGFCIIEVLFDESQKPLDYRFLEINPAFEKHTELIAAQGKTMREIAPKHEAYWFEIYGKIALTGQPARFQNRAEQLHRWFDVYAFRFGRPEQRQVAILFTDITERRQAAEALRESEKRLQAA
ncbi:MAG TPA: CHASE3 domain-containing protein, partial [Clostridia bacterium]|nr:CHASE3 domain-containing protein [Clostridia bacterium]